MARKRKPTPDDEPLFEENNEPEPKSGEELGPCKVKGCKLTAMPGERYCAMHGLMINGMNYLKENGQEALARGDWAAGLLHGGLGTLLDVVGHALTKKVSAGGFNIPFAGFPTGAPPPPPRLDPFEVLGLDAATATVEDVRRIQRELAKLYHTDKRDSHVSQAKLAEINAAATEAVALLQKRP